MEWCEIQRVLVICAHPDDPDFGSAGTSAKLARDGKEVTYIIVTDGSKGSSDAEMTPERLIALRQGEQREAARIAGVRHVAFLNYPDGMLLPTLELRKAITAEIRRYRPDVIITQSPVRDLSIPVGAQHPDHLAVGEATLAAVYPCARDRLTFPELLAEGLEPHAVREVWIGGTSSADYFVDISETIATKVAALIAHQSQVDPDRIKEFIPERARRTGADQGIKFAEAFRRLQMP
jgi:LmbE family N-acetylglucosaminyl deacetylase